MSRLMTFTPTQQQAIHTPQGVAVLAGAGSGKTRVLTERIVHFLRLGVSPAAILAVTFTDAAASELRHRIWAAVQHCRDENPAFWDAVLQALPLMQISTIHSLCARIAREHGVESQAGLAFEMLEPADAELWRLQHLSQILAELPPELVATVPGRVRTTALPLLLEDPLRTVSALERARNVQGERELSVRLGDLYQLVSARFEELKLLDGVATFGDLESWAARALQTSQARAYYQQRWSHVLVDEMQDTTPAQWSILQGLIGEQTNLTIVGDDKQSIYAFRGAEASVFQQATEWIRARGGDLLSMHTSFRTTPELVEELNAALPTLMPGPDEHQPTATPFAPLDAARPPSPDPDRATLELQIVQGGDHGTRVQTVAYVMASRMQALIGSPVWERSTGQYRPARLADMALLIRSRTHLKTYEAALRDAGLPYVVHGGMGLYERPEVQDAITFLRALADPSDDLLLIALLRGSYFNWTDDDLLSLSEVRRAGESLWHALRCSHQPRHVLTVQQLTRWREASVTCSASQLLTLADEQTGMLQVHAAQRDGSRRAGNLQLLHTLLRRWAQAGERDLIPVARRLGQLQRLRAREGEAQSDHSDAVQVMTVHAAKGLEFPVIFFGDALQHHAPPPPSLRLDPEFGLVLRESGQSQSLMWQQVQERVAEQDRSEAQRVNYVAYTRAADRLVLILNAADSPKRQAALHRFVDAFPNHIPRSYHATGRVDAPPPLPLQAKGSRLVLAAQPGRGTALPARLPVTALSSYAQCPRQFAYRYLHGYLPLARLWNEEIPTAEPLVQRAASRDIGDAVHRAIEHSWTARDIKRRLRHLAAIDRTEVTSLVERLSGDAFTDLQAYTFEREVELEHCVGAFTFSGIADAVDCAAGVVIDYKTDQVMVPEDHLPQLAVYARHFGLDQAALVYLRHDTVHWFGEAELQRGYTEVEALVRRMIKHDFSPAPCLSHCSLCAYQGICDASLSSQASA